MAGSENVLGAADALQQALDIVSRVGAPSMRGMRGLDLTPERFQAVLDQARDELFDIRAIQLTRVLTYCLSS